MLANLIGKYHNYLLLHPKLESRSLRHIFFTQKIILIYIFLLSSFFKE